MRSLITVLCFVSLSNLASAKVQGFTETCRNFSAVCEKYKEIIGDGCLRAENLIAHDPNSYLNKADAVDSMAPLFYPYISNPEISKEVRTDMANAAHFLFQCGSSLRMSGRCDD